MKMIKNAQILLILLLMLSFSYCSDDKDKEILNQLTVQLVSEEPNLDYSTFQISLKDLRSGESHHSLADKNGQAIFSVPLGQFDIVAENLIDNASTHYGNIKNYTLSKTGDKVNVNIESIIVALDKTFVLDELYFNCSSNSEWDKNYYEEYFTIRNISKHSLYADGLSFAICGDYNAIEDNKEKSVYLPDTIIVSQIYTIPGTGRDYLVKSGESIVIAHSAIDHTEGGVKPNAADLSGADFEIYVPHENSMTTDNPEVKNLIVTYSMFQAFQWGYTGYAPLMLFKTPVNLQEFVDNNKINMNVTGSYGNMKQDYVKLPSSWVIDGVETGAIGNHYHKVLPNSIDRGVFLIEDDTMLFGGFKGLFVHRKPSETEYLQDTNNSTEDFLVVPNGRKNYPAK